MPGRPSALVSCTPCIRPTAVTVPRCSRALPPRRACTTRSSTPTTGSTATLCRRCSPMCAPWWPRARLSTCSSRTTSTSTWKTTRRSPWATAACCPRVASSLGTRWASSASTRTCSCTRCSTARRCCATAACLCRATPSMWTTSSPMCRCRAARSSSIATWTCTATSSVARTKASTRRLWFRATASSCASQRSCSRPCTSMTRWRASRCAPTCSTTSR